MSSCRLLLTLLAPNAIFAAQENTDSVVGERANSSCSDSELSSVHDRLRELHKDFMPPCGREGYSAKYVRVNKEQNYVLKAVEPQYVESLKRESCDRLKQVIDEVNAEAQEVALELGIEAPRCILPEELFVDENSLPLNEISPEVGQWGAKWLPCNPKRKMGYSVSPYGGITLWDFIESAEKLGKPIPRREIAQTFLGLVTLFKAMQSRNLVHRDLALQNILRGPALIDFGSHQFVSETEPVKYGYLQPTNVFQANGSRLRYRLPSVNFKLYPRFDSKIHAGKALEIKCWTTAKLLNDEMFANDLWFAVMLLFRMVTGHELIPEEDGIFHTYYEAIEVRIRKFRSKFEDRKELFDIILALVDTMGRHNELPLERYGGDVQRFTELLLTHDFTKPIRDWLDPGNKELLKEQSDFDAAYDAKYSTDSGLESVRDSDLESRRRLAERFMISTRK